VSAIKQQKEIKPPYAQIGDDGQLVVLGTDWATPFQFQPEQVQTTDFREQLEEHVRYP
jgi:hypothetical protein